MRSQISPAFTSSNVTYIVARRQFFSTSHLFLGVLYETMSPAKMVSSLKGVDVYANLLLTGYNMQKTRESLDFTDCSVRRQAFTEIDSILPA